MPKLSEGLLCKEMFRQYIYKGSVYEMLRKLKDKKDLRKFLPPALIPQGDNKATYLDNKVAPFLAMIRFIWLISTMTKSIFGFVRHVYNGDL